MEFFYNFTIWFFIGGLAYFTYKLVVWLIKQY